LKALSEITPRIRACSDGSGDDVGDQLVLERGNFVA
jgi:hypothetical protein